MTFLTFICYTYLSFIYLFIYLYVFVVTFFFNSPFHIQFTKLLWAVSTRIHSVRRTVTVHDNAGGVLCQSTPPHIEITLRNKARM